MEGGTLRGPWLHFTDGQDSMLTDRLSNSTFLPWDIFSHIIASDSLGLLRSVHPFILSDIMYLCEYLPPKLWLLS